MLLWCQWHQCLLPFSNGPRGFNVVKHGFNGVLDVIFLDVSGSFAAFLGCKIPATKEDMTQEEDPKPLATANSDK